MESFCCKMFHNLLINFKYRFEMPHLDEITAMAPVYQCCLFRFSTLKTLLQFNSSPVSLGNALKLSLSHDPLHPVLLDDHFTAVDRRVRIALQIISKCVDTVKDVDKVIIDDGL